jgi:DNA sulfur modification protein DndE
MLAAIAFLWALASISHHHLPIVIDTPLSRLDSSHRRNLIDHISLTQLLIALKQRCHNDGLGTDPDTLATQFRLHLHRGIGYLAGDPNLKTIETLIEKAVEATPPV